MGIAVVLAASISFIMKFFIVASLLALATVDPVMGGPHRKVLVYNAPAYVPTFHSLHNREAEAEAEADPQVFYNTYGYFPQGYTPYNTYIIILYLPLPCICTILPIFCTGSNLQLPFLANKDYHTLWEKKKKKKKKKS